ncbi:pyrroline-5-carboxylate reductase [Bradymonadaceae bacterium TMQ3]|uniref:Pyrroline-5-carboxylate reductase n=1 Tax=Lujinxingia sediminis TaxID=2480984 RepID=A0ABY0CXT5_9DELT|nr:pyrroline-5-carboxylate reductase [Lujinxingia sediminis]RDV39260.1 pyrroline-5-carboxylate reductase [Bradymonadaceae bacterium TMQ3]RVU48701.1 pyrroline-5-carboxylate reductase [Lujinxingia sediminis]TXC77994.1 pyrroline-5-carboxylate reductase [Bradymonadales bacterium TMQ1]
MMHESDDTPEITPSADTETRVVPALADETPSFDARLDDYLVILLGCGKMGRALAEGWIDSGALDPRRLVCLDAHEKTAQDLADDLDAREAIPEIELDENDQPTRRPRLYVVAVKPGDVRAVLESRHEEFTDEDTIISIAAGVKIASMRRYAGPLAGMARAMPNTPALVGAGVTGVMGDGTVDMAAVGALFEAVGKVVRIKDEDHFHALTAISGSGPAYIFTAVEALADGGVFMGLDRKTAIELASGVMEGAARLAQERSYVHTAELKDQVASPGGTTIAALVALEEHGFRHALIRAVEAAARRSAELSEEVSERRIEEEGPIG